MSGIGYPYNLGVAAGDPSRSVSGNVGAFGMAVPPGYQQLTGQVLQQLQGYGAAESQGINDAYAQQRGQAQQGLTDRGLGNTTVTSAVNRGLTLDQQKAQIALGGQLANLAASYRAQLGLAGLNSHISTSAMQRPQQPGAGGAGGAGAGGGMAGVGGSRGILPAGSDASRANMSFMPPIGGMGGAGGGHVSGGGGAMGGAGGAGGMGRNPFDLGGGYTPPNRGGPSSLPMGNPMSLLNPNGNPFTAPFTGAYNSLNTAMNSLSGMGGGGETGYGVNGDQSWEDWITNGSNTQLTGDPSEVPDYFPITGGMDVAAMNGGDFGSGVGDYGYPMTQDYFDTMGDTDQSNLSVQYDNANNAWAYNDADLTGNGPYDYGGTLLTPQTLQASDAGDAAYNAGDYSYQGDWGYGTGGDYGE